MKRDLLTATIGMLVLTLVLGIAYPLLITAVGQVAFHGDANGQQIEVSGTLVGSKLIGQSFAEPIIGKNGKPEEKEQELLTKPDARYFQSRPSATEGGEYNAAASAFSNRGPNSELTEEDDAADLRAYLQLNRPYDSTLTASEVPVDAVNTSGSNLDPEISQANARIQAHRIAAVRKLSLRAVDELIARYTSGRGLGFSGEPGVNVLELNLALDRLTGASS